MNFKDIQQYFAQLVFDIFAFSLLAYLAILFAELAKKGIITNYFNTTYLLAIVVISGVGAVLLPSSTEKKSHWSAYCVLFAVSLYSGILIYQQALSSGTWAYLFGFGAFCIPFCCGLIIISNPKPSNPLTP
ncbi:MAG: hypothetical protein Q7S47_02300 [bacterium]|nr:hypothetical protein [bacterium]